MATSDEALRAMRDTVPAWALEKASDKQVNYIRILIEDREVPQTWLDRIEELADKDEITKGKAGDIISKLKVLPKRTTRDRSKKQPDFDDVPAGRYAVQIGDDENDLGFYRVWRAPDNPFIVRVYRQHSDDDHQLTTLEGRSILKRIYRMGAAESAMLYGHKIGRCSICNRTLTNRISRELGIGPICGGRLSDDWDMRVKQTRAGIVARGYDPNEEVS